MAKVLKKKRTKGGTKTYKCIAQTCVVEQEGGSREITPGQNYYEVSLFRQPARHRHVRCGMFTATQMSNSKMAQVDEAVGGANLGACESTDDIKSALADVANVARDVGEEYSESASNISQSFPGSPTADACETAASELDDWAQRLDDWEPSTDAPDEEDEGADYLADCISEAEDLLSEQPSYEG